MASNIEIIIGTYEEFLLGYKLDKKNDKDVITQSFADKSHTGAIKCLAVQGQWIATGATDDRIFIYDMKSRKQTQILLTHEGTINALAFTPDETHLLSGGDDGRMLAVRLNTWFPEATWKKAHSGSAVTHISCHPSGKLALSLGSDLVLRTWNLVKGRVAYKTNLKSKSSTLGTLPDCLAWSSSGDYFTLTGQRAIEIWSIKTADVVKSYRTSAKPICVSWVAADECLIGLEDGKILWVNLEGEEIAINAHDARVKAIAFRDNILVSASSSGEIKMWHVNAKKRKLKEIAATNIGCRPTCIGILDLEQFGADYILSKKIAPKQEEKQKSVVKTNKPQERGVVTIEYENDNKNTDTEDNDNEEDEADSITEEEVANDTDTDKEIVEDDSDSEDNEPQVRLPKSRKRKQQLLSKQNQSKNAKLFDESSISNSSLKSNTNQKKTAKNVQQKKQKHTMAK